MKKYLLLALITLVAVACSKEETEKSTFDYPMEALYGTWRITHIKQKDGTMLDVTTARAEKYFKPTYAKFRSDGTYVGIGQFGDGVADYKAKGKTITCYIDGAEYLRFDIISLVGGIAEMEMYIEKGGKPYRIRCEKQ